MTNSERQDILMENLGKYLKQLRQERNLSMREVEQQSKSIYQQDKRHHLSHTYLKKLEESKYKAPSPFKLKALSVIYKVEYTSLIELAGYLEESNEAEQKFHQVKNHLNSQGVNPDYFFNFLLDLGEQSILLINRTVAMMAVQEKQIQQKQVTTEKMAMKE